ncbi:PLP-dependent aspartate aminotransferase family protein [Hyphobacterium sp. HN65]|uniref:PLP-dependent aspartate aminotransferase family protein n=1 Tax=Hyphobacterium lacteum TaxID=3116575 RepID=A0ABU7LM84_9PROT|nr:PLP-dependent aspartate aminotransferase family protein [Hyphobacterium sp. HN65]MEE2525036.1 PLP-dependent aspartate aminotransferase family protein [Hyphobacterium sp. HN65]
MADEHREIAAVQALHRIDPETGAVIPPVHLSSTYGRGSDNELLGSIDYRRPHGPTEQHAADVIARLEGAAETRLFSSGMAAIAAVFETVPTGGHVVAQTEMYYGAKALLNRLAAKQRLSASFVEPGNLEALRNSVRPGETDLVWVETPANPGWKIVDIAPTADIAHAAGAPLAIDSTCAPPCTTRPLELDADIVMHSATKYLNGHSDVLAGVLSTREITPRWAEIGEIHNKTGALAGGMESWLLMRGLRTLFIRFERQSANALAVAEAMQTHPAVESVLYPGLPSHTGHEIAARQMTNGFGGMLSLRLKGGYEAARKLAAGTKIFIQATSLGGVESLIEHRKPIEGPDSPTPDDLVRLSCGIEPAESLIEDLRQALA